MSRTAARFTQADIARAIRAAKQVGAHHIVLQPNGSIVIKIAGHLRAVSLTREEDADPCMKAVQPMADRNRASRKGRLDEQTRGNEALNNWSHPWVSVSGRQLVGLLEKRALGIYYRNKDQPLGYLKGTGFITSEKLEARGLISVALDRGKDRVPFYRITTDGERVWKGLEPHEANDLLTLPLRLRFNLAGVWGGEYAYHRGSGALRCRVCVGFRCQCLLRKKIGARLSRPRWALRGMEKSSARLRKSASYTLHG